MEVHSAIPPTGSICGDVRDGEIPDHSPALARRSAAASRGLRFSEWEFDSMGRRGDFAEAGYIARGAAGGAVALGSRRHAYSARHGGTWAQHERKVANGATSEDRSARCGVGCRV